MLDYLLALLPITLLVGGLLLLIPKTAVSLRVAVLILLFIVARDSMGTHGFWQLTEHSMTLTASTAQLLSLAALCVGLCLYVLRTEPLACKHLQGWRTGHVLRSMAWGLAGAAVIGLLVYSLKSALAMPAGSGSIWPLQGATLIFALAGNAFEELLFRGIVQARLAVCLAPWRAIGISALLFSACHSWLALMNPHASLSILLFTLIEGFIAAVVYWRAGLIAAVLTHGLAIYGLAIGLY